MFLGKVGVVFELDVGGLGFPGRHSTFAGGEGDHFAISFSVCVSFEAEGGIFAFSVAFDTIVIDDRCDGIRVSDLFNVGGRWFGLRLR